MAKCDMWRAMLLTNNIWASLLSVWMMIVCGVVMAWMTDDSVESAWKEHLKEDINGFFALCCAAWVVVMTYTVLSFLIWMQKPAGTKGMRIGFYCVWALLTFLELLSFIWGCRNKYWIHAALMFIALLVNSMGLVAVIFLTKREKSGLGDDGEEQDEEVNTEDEEKAEP